MFILRWALVAVWLLASVSSAAAHIALDISTTCTTTERGLRVNMTLANQGNEAVWDIGISARCEGATASLNIPGPLDTGQAGTYHLDLDPALAEPGTYAVTAHIKYHDQTGYPFTTVDATTFALGRPAMTMVFPQISPLVLKGTGGLKVRLDNTDKAAHWVRVWLETPETLSSPDHPQELRLEPGGHGQVSFRLRNRFARLGSSQPVIVRATYDSGDLRRTAVVKSYVTVARPEKFFKKYGWAFWAAAGLALALALVIQGLRDSSLWLSGKDRT